MTINTMTKKRIAVVTSTFFPAIGGSEIVAYNISLSLQDKGYEPYLIVNFKNYLYFLRKKINVKLLPLPPLILTRLEKNPRIVLFFIRRIFSLYQSMFKFEHWYANTGYPAGIVTSNFCSKYQYKCTLRCGGEDIQVLRKINYGFRINKKIDLLNNEDISIKKASVFTFLAVGRNHIKKDFSTLIYALLILQSISNVGFKIVFIGSGYSQIKHLVNQLEISHLVTFKFISHKKITDYRNLTLPSHEMVRIYQSSHCFISPSLIEGFPNAVAEAMALGLPVIGSNTPGNQDLIKDNTTGLLYDAGDSENLAYAMKTLLEDKNKLITLGKAGRAFSKNWNFETVSELYLKTFGLKK